MLASPQASKGAEEVEKVESLLTFRNDQGEIEGVKYNQLSAVLVNAIREQQAQIHKQQQQIRRQQQQISALQARLAASEAGVKESVGVLKGENVDLKARLEKLERSVGSYVLAAKVE